MPWLTLFSHQSFLLSIWRPHTPNLQSIYRYIIISALYSSECTSCHFLLRVLREHFSFWPGRSGPCTFSWFCVYFLISLQLHLLCFLSFYNCFSVIMNVNMFYHFILSRWTDSSDNGRPISKYVVEVENEFEKNQWKIALAGKVISYLFFLGRGHLNLIWDFVIIKL